MFSLLFFFSFNFLDLYLSFNNLGCFIGFFLMVWVLCVCGMVWINNGWAMSPHHNNKKHHKVCKGVQNSIDGRLVGSYVFNFFAFIKMVRILKGGWLQNSTEEGIRVKIWTHSVHSYHDSWLWGLKRTYDFRSINFLGCIQDFIEDST